MRIRKTSYPYELIATHDFPIIPLVIHHQGNKFNFRGLIDSGAMMSIFKEEVATTLNIPVESGKITLLQGVGGRIKGYIHNLSLEIAGKTFLCPVIFSKEYSVSVNLLGRAGFFENFKITFDEKKKIIELV